MDKNMKCLFKFRNKNFPPLTVSTLMFFNLILISSCSYSPENSGSSNQTKKMAEQNAQTSAKFNKIAGTYSGLIKTPNGDETIQVNLSTLAVSEGVKNPDGSDRIRITLAVSYLKIDPVGRPLVNFAVSYTPETGELTLINQDDKSKKDLDEVNTIFAHIINETMTGTVRSSTHDLGTLELIKTSNGGVSIPNGAEEAYNDRLRQQYMNIAGSYVGCVIPTENGSLKTPYTAKMLLSLFEDSTDPKNPTPTLAGNFHRDTDKTDGTDTALSAIYRPELKPPTLTITGKPYISNNGYISTFSGTYMDGDFTGSFTSNKKGLEGRIFMSKGSLYPRACRGAFRNIDSYDDKP